MLEYLTLILVCQLIGEIAVTTLDIPFPGPVAGMVLLFLFLVLKGTVPEQLGHVSGALLNNLSLLFVPAGVGVMVHLELLGTDVWPLSARLRPIANQRKARSDAGVSRHMGLSQREPPAASDAYPGGIRGGIGPLQESSVESTAQSCAPECHSDPGNPVWD